MASASVEDQRRHFASDTVIFREGDTSDFFYLITAGKVRMLLTTHCPLPTLYYPPLTTDSRVRCARYPLPTTHYPPPTTHHPLLTTKVRKLTPEELAGHGHRAPAIPADEELGPGDYFGTSAILGSGQRHSTMVAVTDVQVVS